MIKKVVPCLAILIITSIVASGAFSSVSAERPVSISVADDSNARLSLIATSPYTSYQDGMITIDISNGANMNAVTDFGKVFTIINNGTNNVDVTIRQYLNGKDVTLTSPLLFSKSSSATPQNMNAIWNTGLNAGATIDVYMKLFTNLEDYPSEIGNVIDTIQIIAE